MGRQHADALLAAAEFAAQVTGTLDREPSYATFADGLWVLDAIDHARRTA